MVGYGTFLVIGDVWYLLGRCHHRRCRRPVVRTVPKEDETFSKERIGKGRKGRK